jgi:hypothetical protein
VHPVAHVTMFNHSIGARGSVFVEAQWYKTGCGGFDSRALSEFFSLRNPFSRAISLGSTTEMSTRNLPGGVRSVGLTTPCHLQTDSLENVGASTSHSFMGLFGLL